MPGACVHHANLPGSQSGVPHRVTYPYWGWGGGWPGGGERERERERGLGEGVEVGEANVLALPPPDCCRANMAHIRQSSPDSGLDFQVNLLSCSLFARKQLAWGLIDFVYHSTLGLRVIKKKKNIEGS